MTKTLAAAAALLALSATPALAGSTQSNLRLCKAELADGHLSSTATVDFKSAKRNIVKLEVRSADGAETPVICRVKRGEVVSIEMDGRALVLRADAAADTSGQ